MTYTKADRHGLESVTMKRVMMRVVPLLIIAYIVSYLDRVNVGLAALTMNSELGLSAEAYGLGAGIFFITYFFFELPSNLMLHRFGARIWIARIMVTWGILSGAMGFIPQIAAVTGLSHQTVFYVIRLLLGAAEAGFFPGIIFYLTLWFPKHYRARVIGYFMTALPMAGVIGGPLGGWLLGLGGKDGFSGWQWLFILEAIPSIILSGVVFVWLTDTPEQASWLSVAQRQWLLDTLAAERRVFDHLPKVSVWSTLRHPMVLCLGFVYFTVVYMNYTVGFFLPSIIHSFGLTNQQTGLLAAIPALVGAISMVVWGRRSDMRGERKWHLVIALGVGGVAFAAAALGQSPLVVMICFSIAAFGIYGSQPVFWTMPSTFLSGSAAAAGIAIINALANLSGFMGPSVMGWVKTVTGNYTIALLIAAGMAILATLVVAGFSQRRFQIDTSGYQPDTKSEVTP